MPLNVPKTNKLLRLLDYVMLPLMFVLGGFRGDAIQETHPWHLWRDFDHQSLDRSKTVEHTGGTEKLKHHFSFLFHAPIFGGWKNYIVLKPVDNTGAFRIGWVVYKNGAIKEASIHKLIIKNSIIRVLSGSANYSGYFFAVDVNGRQIPLKIVGKGRLGDKKFPGARLF